MSPPLHNEEEILQSENSQKTWFTIQVTLMQRMDSFATLPYSEQLLIIESADQLEPAEQSRLLAITAALADSEPFTRTVAKLATSGRMDPTRLSGFLDLAKSLTDPALLHLLSLTGESSQVDEVLHHLSREALLSWPLERITALALFARWQRRHYAGTYKSLCDRAAAELDKPDANPRWVFFLSGEELLALSQQTDWTSRLSDAIALVVEVLARAPKSISQANAESLLASRVYADPGHFFFELLQNADDAGASHWEAHIDADAVTIRHNGMPFSLRDLVGVLSIGQTTKSAEQIGFFGVGFKSVYEICDRPRIHSGILDIEIAHVSIPRLLSTHSEAKDAGHTTLILPYARALDANSLYRKAKAIPPETLLTLSHLDSMHIDAPDAEPWAWEESWSGQIATLRRVGTDDTRRFLCIQETFSFEGSRESGRTKSSPVLIAISQDSDGCPIPTTGPTLYSFLPTSEHTGLRFMAHARFDVTLDRERLEHDSRWNHELLAAVGTALANAVRALVKAAHSPLPILSAPAELSPLVASITKTLADELKDSPCLPGADGTYLAPSQARLLPEVLASALAGLDLGGGDYALSPLPDRERSVALALGATELSTNELSRFLSSHLTVGAHPPDWLTHDVLDALGRSALPDETLASLPLLTDGAGLLVQPAKATRTSSTWAKLYASLRAYVSTSTYDALPQSLRQRFRLPEFDSSQIAQDCADPLLYPKLIEREHLLLQALMSLNEDELQQLNAFALLRTSSGERVSIDDGLLRLDSQLEPLRERLARRVPITAPVEPADTTLVQRWVPPLDIARLVALLPTAPAKENDEWLLSDFKAIRTLLDEKADILGHALVEGLSRCAIFEDCHSTYRPLHGAHRALLTEDERLPELLPDWPWLREQTPFVHAARPSTAGVRFVVESLFDYGDKGLPAGLVAEHQWADVLGWVATRAEDLTSRLIELLASGRIWPDTRGKRKSLQQLRRQTESTWLSEFFETADVRSTAHRASETLVQALGIGERLAASSIETAVGDLLEYGDSIEVPPHLLAPLLNEAAITLPDAVLSRVARVPLFRDGEGVKRALGSWDAPVTSHCHLGGTMRALLTDAGFPLLSDDDETLLKPFIEASGVTPPTRSDLIRLLHHDSILMNNMDGVREALSGNDTPLDADAQRMLQAIPFLHNQLGQLRAANTLWSQSTVSNHLETDEYNELGLSAYMLAPEQESMLSDLGLELRSLAELLSLHLLPKLQPGLPLSSQSQPWNTRGSLVRLLELAHQAALDITQLPLSVDQGLRLHAGPLHTAAPASQRLVAALALPSTNLADPEWSDLLSDTLANSLLTPVSPRQVAHTLQAQASEETPRDGHPLLHDLSLVYDWILENRDALQSDPDALASLRSAAVLPSQKRTLRAPRDLVLDSDLPDLGLDWGLAPDVPEPVALWLSQVFEIDRHQRRTIVEHLLAGVDSAAEADDTERAAELITFLAHTIRADALTEQELSNRVSYSKIRARLKVPVSDGTWARARRALLIPNADANQVDAFCSDPPPRIELGSVDSATRSLLIACGASTEVPNELLLACLAGNLRRSGILASRSLSRYILERTLAKPSLRQTLKLDLTPWVPAQDGSLKRPQDLLWPNDLARALVGPVPERFPADEVIRGLPEKTGQTLGFRSAAGLNLSDVARLIGSREASEALLEWLEEGLVTQRFKPLDVKNTMRDSLLLWDQQNILRPPSQLALRGASDLFGERRGDFPDGARFAKLARALGIPRQPNTSMVLEFLAEVSADPPEPSQELAESLSRCLSLLGESLERGTQVRLPPNTVVAGLSSGELTLTRLSAVKTRIFDPESLAETLPPSIADSFIEVLLSPVTGSGLKLLLLESGTRDLWSDFHVTKVLAGPETPGFRDDASELHKALSAILGQRVGSRVCVVEPLSAEGALSFQQLPSGYREMAQPKMQVQVDALLFEDTLWLTPQSVEDPQRIAPALENDPVRRAAMIRWLAAKDWNRPPKQLKSADDPTQSTASEGDPNLVDRIRNFFRSPSPSERSISHTDARAVTPSSSPDFDKDLFRPKSEVRPQLGSDGGFSARRMKQPDFGFAFSPTRVAPPWLYAPKLISVDFRARGQVWRAANLTRPTATTSSGMLVFRGKLPRGEAVLPVPMFGTVQHLSIDGERVVPAMGPSGGYRIYLHEPGEVRFRVSLGSVPDLDRATTAPIPNATKSFVPDAELPGVVLDFVESFDTDTPAIARALAIRDFIRKHYRYDPSYLEDAGVSRWLSRITKGRANAHIAALHAGRDARHLGAGVCYELNVLACELMRRAGVPAAIATGWVLDAGSLSEADHLWCVALLRDARGSTLWIPIDASSTQSGRPLRVPKRPPVRVRAPKDRRAKAPSSTRWDIGAGRTKRRGQDSVHGRSRKQRNRVPRAELLRVIRHLERTTGRTLDANEKSRLQRSLDNPQAASDLLSRILE